jgi:hypothetical protein
MPLAAKQTLTFPGPTVGVTLLGSALNLTNYNVVATCASDEQIAILSIGAGYDMTSPSVDSSLVVAYGDSDTILLAFDTGGRSNDHGSGYRYPPLLPVGQKLSVRARGGSETNLVVYIQYMIVPS